ncbi:MAG: hypothetical protein ACYS74_10075, partial [Planctomycetota bacterium]
MSLSPIEHHCSPGGLARGTAIIHTAFFFLRFLFEQNGSGRGGVAIPASASLRNQKSRLDPLYDGFSVRCDGQIFKW